MPSGVSVKPKKWSNESLNLFDNKEYSAIWGNYDNSPQKSLGVRWNGSDENLGYPNQAGYSLWYVEPDFLAKPILLELSYQVSKDNSLGDLANIQKALSETEEVKK